MPDNLPVLTTTVPSGPAPIIQIVCPAGAIPAGQAMRITGRAGNHEWDVRGGTRVSKGEQLVLGDALAPINTPITYTARWDNGEIRSDPVTRPWAGRSLLTDVVGTGRVDLLWQGDDEREIDQRTTLHTIPGRATPVAVMAPIHGAGTLTLKARTDLANTPGMRALAEHPGARVLFHNPARCFQCVRGACDVPLATVLVLTSVSHGRSSRPDEAEREWSLKAAVVSQPEMSTPLALSTWDDFDRAEALIPWSRFDSRAASWDEFDRIIWQEEGQ
jgi:hypothetical protein